MQIYDIQHPVNSNQQSVLTMPDFHYYDIHCESKTNCISQNNGH